MTKYNLSEIMTNAWALRRNLMLTMSAALKKAWAMAKEVKKMIGTDKQIAWATEIRSNVVRTFQAVIAQFQPMAATNAMVAKNIEDVQTRIDLLNAENVHAGDIIDLFKGIRFSGDLQHDFNEVMTVYRVTAPQTATARTLLAR